VSELFRSAQKKASTLTDRTSSWKREHTQYQRQQNGGRHLRRPGNVNDPTGLWTCRLHRQLRRPGLKLTGNDGQMLLYSISLVVAAAVCEADNATAIVQFGSAVDSRAASRRATLQRTRAYTACCYP